MFMEFLSRKKFVFYCVCNLTQTLTNVVRFILFFFQKLVKYALDKSFSDVINFFDSSSKFLLHQNHTEKKRDTIAQSKVEVLATLSTRGVIWTVANAIIYVTKLM